MSHKKPKAPRSRDNYGIAVYNEEKTPFRNALLKWELSKFLSANDGKHKREVQMGILLYVDWNFEGERYYVYWNEIRKMFEVCLNKKRKRQSIQNQEKIRITTKEEMKIEKKFEDVFAPVVDSFEQDMQRGFRELLKKENWTLDDVVRELKENHVELKFESELGKGSVEWDAKQNRLRFQLSS